MIRSVQNRWAWLAINLITAFVASRVIGVFEDAIEKLVALAALMPIVAGIGGNSGNQTITMIVRALALGQLQPNNISRLWRKEIGVAVVNGVVWGRSDWFDCLYFVWQSFAGCGDDRCHDLKFNVGSNHGRLGTVTDGTFWT